MQNTSKDCIKWHANSPPIPGFAEYSDVSIGGDETVRVYRTETASVPSISTSKAELDSSSASPDINVVLLHGAGLSTLSFAKLVEVLPECLQPLIKSGQSFSWRCFGFDLPGHGATVIQDEAHLPEARLRDVISRAFSFVFPKSEPCRVVIVGHSLGGSVAVNLASKSAEIVNGQICLGESGAVLSGIVILDIVEGTALESLEMAKTAITKRPIGFDSIEQAIQYALSSGAITNPDSARISVPDQLAEHEMPEPGAPRFVWRTNMIQLLPYVRSWFEGMSDALLSLQCRPKLVILAGTDRLDTGMACGHMQGKFQLVVLPQVHVGHLVHEDAPRETGYSIAKFLVRNFAPLPRGFPFLVPQAVALSQ